MSLEAFVHIPPGWGMAGLSSLVALLAMIHVAWRDCLIWEIDFAVLAVAALNMAVVILRLDGLAGLGDAALAALLCGAIAYAIWLWRPGKIGRGDLWLIGFLGFVAGSDLLPLVMAVFLILTVVTCALYSLRRGKRLFRSMIPASLPGIGAGITGLLWRLSAAGPWSATASLPAPTPVDILLFWAALITALSIAAAWRPDW